MKIVFIILAVASIASVVAGCILFIVRYTKNGTRLRTLSLVYGNGVDLGVLSMDELEAKLRSISLSLATINGRGHDGSLVLKGQNYVQYLFLREGRVFIWLPAYEIHFAGYKLISYSVKLGSDVKRSLEANKIMDEIVTQLAPQTQIDRERYSSLTALDPKLPLFMLFGGLAAAIVFIVAAFTVKQNPASPAKASKTIEEYNYSVIKQDTEDALTSSSEEETEASSIDTQNDESEGDDTLSSTLKPGTYLNADSAFTMLAIDESLEKGSIMSMRFDAAAASSIYTIADHPVPVAVYEEENGYKVILQGNALHITDITDESLNISGSKQYDGVLNGHYVYYSADTEIDTSSFQNEINTPDNTSNAETTGDFSSYVLGGGYVADNPMPGWNATAYIDSPEVTGNQFLLSVYGESDTGEERRFDCTLKEIRHDDYYRCIINGEDAGVAIYVEDGGFSIGCDGISEYYDMLSPISCRYISVGEGLDYMP